MTTIPDDCVSIILTYLNPLTDLIRCRRVCKLFDKYTVLAIAQVAHLSISLANLPTLPQQEVWWRHEGILATKQLLSQFPNVKTLVVSSTNMHFWQQFRNLFYDVIAKTPMRDTVEEITILIEHKWDMLASVNLDDIFTNLKHCVFAQIDLRYSYCVYEYGHPSLIDLNRILRLNEGCNQELNIPELYQLDTYGKMFDDKFMNKIHEIESNECDIDPCFEKDLLVLWRKIGFNPNCYINDTMAIDMLLAAAHRSIKPSKVRQKRDLETPSVLYVLDAVRVMVKEGLDEADAKNAARKLDKKNKFKNIFSWVYFIDQCYNEPKKRKL
jgi:hypothetical protein